MTITSLHLHRLGRSFRGFRERKVVNGHILLAQRPHARNLPRAQAVSTGGSVVPVPAETSSVIQPQDVEMKPHIGSKSEDRQEILTAISDMFRKTNKRRRQ